MPLFANVNSNVTGNTIGGSSPGEGNLISGNGLSGVSLQGTGTTNNTILGNLIGTIASGLGALPNATNGIFITDASDNTIGGTGLTDGNLIAFNLHNGIIDADGRAQSHSRQPHPLECAAGDRSELERRHRQRRR